ncbi:SRPBCC domain-containing protein [Pedobacter sp. P351]|uniref:SRPBCC family protein n=1 Tax=Pedobacter superstes TaxID=3133441 RepID=UPI0030AA9C50
MQRDIRHQFYFPQPPEIVWEYLTKTELIAQWLMENDFTPLKGHKFQLKTRPKIKLGFDGTVYCEVLEFDYLRRLSYSWKGGISTDKPTLDSVVIWTLSPASGGTELLLEHTGFNGIKNYLAFIIMNMGWLKIGKRLSGHLKSPATDKANT